MKIMTWCAILFAAGNVAASSMAQTHDGFFLNMAVGAAGGGMREKADFANISYSGKTTLVNFRIGGCPVPNLAFSADFQDYSLRDISAKFNGEALTLDKDVEISVMSMALGVTYYISEILFVGANFAPAGSLTLRTQDEEETFNGEMIGYSFRIGKEWWVSDNWGLGVEFDYSHSTLSKLNFLNGEGSDWVTNTYGILFTATFN